MMVMLLDSVCSVMLLDSVCSVVMCIPSYVVAEAWAST
jgi:hypothetical protein